MTGRLIVVGTPIGNLDDMSPRAVQALQQADRILAEDTRHSAKLMRHFAITTPMSAWHAHNENDDSRLRGLLNLLQQGNTLALISDAGMPLISDPGYSLVRCVRDAGLAVECVPGPTALTTALVMSGFPAERFIFDGFLPAKSSARKERLNALKLESRTVIV
ncbi:MAG: 16S rRNA (cytidine(1402)-2'-O)-methyltransferase, partial [Oceanococcus sp.]